MKKVLVTGGAGFIGSHTVDLLLERGILVRVLDNLSAGNRDNLPGDDPGLEFLEGDIRSSGDVARAVEGVSHVLHLAAQVSVVNSVEDPPNSADHNIMGFVTVLDAARRAGVARFVYASSAAVYGTPERLPLDESAPLFPLSPYGLEKRVNEQYASLFHGHWGISTLGMRYFNVFGPRQDPSSPYAGVISLFVDRIRAGDPLTIFGDGGQTRDFIYVRDVARANVAALGSGFEGACNVATGTTVNLLDVIDALGGVAGATPEISFLPPREGDIRDSSAVVAALHRELDVRAETGLAEGLGMLLDSTA
ncbi:MAG: NAD-dependent epimerase/dehydratase family protein [Pseudomonadota bacterium]|nr:NAD-dependent epimerase/dehydratase family protein [Pseudomonadota bacterium]